MADDDGSYNKDRPMPFHRRSARLSMPAGSRFVGETLDNATSERAIARREAGVGKDIELPKDELKTGGRMVKPITTPRSLRGGRR